MLDTAIRKTDEFPFLFGRAFIEAHRRRRSSQNPLPGFPFLFGRAFIEAPSSWHVLKPSTQFPFLFGRAFIEATNHSFYTPGSLDFPSFSEGLSLRRREREHSVLIGDGFPFLFGRAFIEVC